MLVFIFVFFVKSSNATHAQEIMKHGKYPLPRLWCTRIAIPLVEQMLPTPTYLGLVPGIIAPRFLLVLDYRV
jgi:hypothetical protein